MNIHQNIKINSYFIFFIYWLIFIKLFFSLELLISSVRGNRVCNNERKAFNVCRTSILGKLVEPEFC
jgi:hypothetical protein